jgi:hypothetical protein
MPLTNTFFIGALPPSAGNDQQSAEDGAETTDTPPQADAGADGGGGERDDAGTVTPAAGDAPSEAAGNWSWASGPASVVLIDMDRTHPIMRFIETFKLLIFSGRAIQGPPGSVELLGADIGPALVIAPRSGYQDMVLGFEIVSTAEDGSSQTNTNWWAERSWPVFMLNVLRHLAGAAESSGAPSFQPGQTVQVRLESAITDAKFRRVGGRAVAVNTGPSGLIEITETEDPGNYRVEADEELADLFTVNLFERSESELAVAKSVDLGYEAVAAASGGVEKRIEYWRWVLLLMLLLLIAEWWLYSRRVA